MTAEEQRELLLCISMRKNVIQTGDPALSAEDVERILAVTPADERRHLQKKQRALSEDSMRLLLLLSKLFNRIAAARVDR